MRTLSRFKCVAILLCLTTSIPVLARSSKVADLYRAAIENPYDSKIINQFIDTLPKVTSKLTPGEPYYVFEGDLLMTYGEVRRHIRDMGIGRTRNPPTGTRYLIVAKRNGTLQYWRKKSQRRLTYVIHHKSFSDAEYKKVVRAFRGAANDWEAACRSCGITFVHKKTFDELSLNELKTRRNSNAIRFFVGKEDLNGGAYAAAFYPHEAKSRRLLRIDPVVFRFAPGGFTLKGVLRHEIGHILGYRHEQIHSPRAEELKKLRGCVFDSGKWDELSPYTPKSVMHYYCEGIGSPQLEITPNDKLGHRRLYARTGRR